MTWSSLPAALALAMMAWPASAGARVLQVQLCTGGTAEIPIDGDHPRKPDCASPCHALLRKRGTSV